MSKLVGVIGAYAGAAIIWYHWITCAACRKPGYAAQMAREHLPAQMARHPKALQLWSTRPKQRRKLRQIMRWIPLPPGYTLDYYREIGRFMRHRARLGEIIGAAP